MNNLENAIQNITMHDVIITTNEINDLKLVAFVTKDESSSATLHHILSKMDYELKVNDLNKTTTKFDIQLLKFPYTITFVSKKLLNLEGVLGSSLYQVTSSYWNEEEQRLVWNPDFQTVHH